MPSELAESGFSGARSGSPYLRYDAFTLTGAVSYETDRFGINSVTNYQYNDNQRSFDSDFANTPSGANVAFTTNPTRNHSFSNETRATAKLSDSFDLLAALLYQRTRFRIRNNSFFNSIEDSAAVPGCRYATLSKDSHTAGETISPYGQLRWKPIEAIEIAAGLRYIHETKDSDFIMTSVNPLFRSTFRYNTLVATGQSFDKWLPEITANYHLSPDANVFVAYKTGYKSGGFSGSSLLTLNGTAADLAFGPEDAKGFEAGLKSILGDKQLRLNLSVYHFRYSGPQVDFFNSA